MKTEVAVIGAGPAGLLAAEVVSKHGYHVEVFEEHNRVGYPVHCAGMVSVKGLHRIGVDPNPVFYQNTIYGGKIFSSDGSCITIKDKKPRAYIIDRGRLDAYLKDLAEQSGVIVNTSRRVHRIIFKEGSANGLILDNSSVETGIIIDAEGPHGRVLARSGILTGQKGIINGFNVDIDVDEIEPDMVEVWFNQEIAKNFFSWVIPLSENRVRCGLATSMKNGHETLSRFVEKRFNKEISTTINSGLVCTGGPIAKTAYQGLLLVGDVAGQVKPTTGGGVVIGGLCAKIAGEISVKVLGEVGSFYDYEKEWRGKYGSELQTMLFLRNILNRLNDEQINSAFHAFIEEGLEEKLTALIAEGDMDMQASIINEALRDPVILSTLVRSLGRFIVSDFLTYFENLSS